MSTFLYIDPDSKLLTASVYGSIVYEWDTTDFSRHIGIAITPEIYSILASYIFTHLSDYARDLIAAGDYNSAYTEGVEADAVSYYFSTRKFSFGISRESLLVALCDDEVMYTWRYSDFEKHSATRITFEMYEFLTKYLIENISEQDVKSLKSGTYFSKYQGIEYICVMSLPRLN